MTDPDLAARSPELTVLAHGAHPHRSAVLDALAAALATIDLDRAGRYLDIVLNARPAAAQRHLEELMATGTYEYQSDYARRLVGAGKTEAHAEAVISVLAARGVDVPADARERIMDCTDLAQLDAWLRRAVTADAAADELFTPQ